MIETPLYLRKLRGKIAAEVQKGIDMPPDKLAGLPGAPDLEGGLQQLSGQGVLSLAVVEVDGLGLINEREGQEAGDRFLNNLVGLLGSESPGNVYRLSGDQFALAMPGVAPEEAVARMEGLRARVAEIAAGKGSTLGDQATVSIGVAGSKPTAKGREKLRNAAEVAMRKAKKDKNRVVVG